MNTYKIFVATALSITLWSCGNNNEKKKEIPQVETQPKTETFALQKQSVMTEISLPAELSGFRQVDLFAKVNSYVKTLNVDIGADVRKGQLLVSLDAPEISSQLSAALSRLHSQEAIYTASNSTYRRLLETSKVEGTIASNDLEQALARKNADFAQLEAAKAAYKEVQVMQGYLQIRAPFNGKVTARNVNIGAYVGQGSQVPLLTVQEQSTLRLAVSVPEAYTGYLKLGDELSFKVTSFRGENFKAKVSRMAGALDNKLRSERVELDVSNSNIKLLPGMVAEVIIPLQSRNTPFVAPKTAVVETTEGTIVIKIVDGKAKHIRVETGLSVRDKIEIFSTDLQEKDILILTANEEIREGSTIN